MKKSAIIVLAVILCVGWFPHGKHTGLTTFSALKVGPGGFLTGIDVSNDGNMVIRMDTFGVWVWDQTAPYCGQAYGGAPTTGCWRDTLTYASLGSNGMFTSPDAVGGAYEVAIGRQSSQNLYMQWGVDNCFYASTDYGRSWNKKAAFTTAFSGTCPNANPNSTGKLTGRHMAVDPANDNIDPGRYARIG